MPFRYLFSTCLICSLFPFSPYFCNFWSNVFKILLYLPYWLCALLYIFPQWWPWGFTQASPQPGARLPGLPGGRPAFSTRALLPGWRELRAAPAQAAVGSLLRGGSSSDLLGPRTWAPWCSRGIPGHVPGQIIFGAVFFKSTSFLAKILFHTF